jgi:pyruvate dehydrogenase (quinone)/pyruvate oxidase
VGLLGNSASVLRELLPQLRRKEDRSFLEKAQKGMDEWRRIMEERANRRDKPMKPQVIAHELGKRLREDAIVSCDSGTIATWWARHIPVKAGQNAQPLWKSRQHGQRTTYVIAAQVAYPRRQCVGFVGDGGFSS